MNCLNCGKEGVPSDKEFCSGTCWISYHARVPKYVPPIYLYVFECQNRYKVGVTADIEERLATLQSANPFLIKEVVALPLKDRDFAYVLERAIHNAFEKYRVRGEWFKLNGEQLEDLIEVVINRAWAKWIHGEML